MRRITGVFAIVILTSMVVHSQSGHLDPSFSTGQGFDGIVTCLALQSGGMLAVGGYFANFGTNVRSSLARLHSDGALDLDFRPVATGLRVVTMQSDCFERLVVGGNGIAMARYLYDGTHDPEFYGPYDTCVWLGRHSGGGIYYSSSREFKRIRTDGSPDSAFASAFVYAWDYGIFAACIRKDGSIIIGGGFNYINYFRRDGLALLDSFGNVSTNHFLTGPGESVGCIIEQPDGKILVTGDFTGSIRRYTAEGMPDGSFTPEYLVDDDGHPGSILCMALQRDGKIVIGGRFTSIGGQPASRLARLLPDGTIDGNFDIGTGADNVVRTILLQPDGRIVVGGSFTSWNGSPVGRIVRLLGDAPVLKMTTGLEGQTVLSWPAVYADYAMQSATNLTAPGWRFVKNDGNVIDQQFFFTNLISAGNVFFRLMKP